MTRAPLAALQANPTMSPSASMSMPSDAGIFGGRCSANTTGIARHVDEPARS
jgi:hypothetical protein